ncbi:GntR family transcriptional regulator [Peptoniphilus equinus]|uniref:GntR family transcriptional regulator n=1 Tax=Peptoniphilus equinus TaxID=3016343 RepID=A0ABY7QU15_9FIRM|nr:GntR family transcriptional regulator [Peptoniphilus equinus]WBW49658.1 GntR family transcriptional regulator [Peptoniphilus equinus]
MSESLVSRVYHELRDRVISGDWMVDERINEKLLAETMHVSRTPIRKALQAIYDEGLLDYTPNFGYHVRVISVKDVDEIYSIRTALEILAFKEASKHLNEARIQTVREIIAQSKDAVARGDAKTTIEQSGLFNRTIYDIADMPRLKVIQVQLQNYLSRFRSISFSGEANDRTKLAVTQHEGIFDAMVDGDMSLLAERIHKHLEQSQNYIREVVERENETRERNTTLKF